MTNSYKVTDSVDAGEPGGGQPSKRDKIRLLGDGVTPPVLEWATNRCLEIMG